MRTTSGALLVLPFGVFLAQACYGGYGGGSSGSTDDTPAAPPAVSGSNAVYTSNIDDGHSHTFSIALTELTSPSDVSGVTGVTESHTHTVEITAAELQDVEVGQTVQVTTGTTESHSHVLTFVKVA